jgi:hypothetical protein
MPSHLTDDAFRGGRADVGGADNVTASDLRPRARKATRYGRCSTAEANAF